MSVEIIIVLAILMSVVVLLVTEWFPLEVVALLVLGVLAATGIANILGRQLLKVAGRKPSLLVVTIMVIAGVLSAFMNNVAVAALMLPVVMDIARKTDCSPSTLLMPLAYGSLLGGLTTMIGTPPNILVSEALRENGLTPFKLFDFTPVGLAVMFSGIAFVTLIGTRMLPKGRVGTETSGARRDFRTEYKLQENLFRITVPPEPTLSGTMTSAPEWVLYNSASLPRSAWLSPVPAITRSSESPARQQAPVSHKTDRTIPKYRII
jgi:di/tricarboxylate transporter